MHVVGEGVWCHALRHCLCFLSRLLVAASHRAKDPQGAQEQRGRGRGPNTENTVFHCCLNESCGKSGAGEGHAGRSEKG